MQLEVHLYLKDQIRFSFALKLKSAPLNIFVISSRLSSRLWSFPENRILSKIRSMCNYLS